MHELLKKLIAKHDGEANEHWPTKTGRILATCEAENQKKDKPEEKPTWAEEDFVAWTALADPSPKGKKLLTLEPISGLS